MTTATLTSTADLATALKGASGGETFLLAPGDYAPLSMAAPRAYSETVTIGAADPGNRPRFVNTVALRSFVNLALDGLSFTSKGSTLTYYPLVRLYGGQNITVSNGLFTGEPNATSVWVDYGFQADGVTNLQVLGSRFQQLAVGTMLTNIKTLLVADNDYSEMGTDAGDFAAITDAQILRNLLEQFTPFAGAHADGFQLHCAGVFAPSSNVLFGENAIFSGPGKRAQGIFVQGDPARYTDPTRRHKSIALRQNLGGATMWNGFMLGETDDALFDGNRLITVLGDEQMKSWIYARRSTGVSQNNSAIQYVDDGTGVTHTNDAKCAAGTMDDVAAARAAWLAKFRAPPAPPKPDPLALVDELASANAAQALAIAQLRASLGG